MNTLIALKNEEIIRQKKHLQHIEYVRTALASSGMLAVISLLILFYGIFGNFLSVAGCWFMVVVTTILTITALYSYQSACYELCSDTNQFAPLPKNKCQEMLDLLASIPEGKDFRESVLSQGREFILMDFNMAKEWKNSEKDRHACKALYVNEMK